MQDEQRVLIQSSRHAKRVEHEKPVATNADHDVLFASDWICLVNTVNQNPQSRSDPEQSRPTKNVQFREWYLIK